MRPANVVLIMADQLKATASHLYGSTFCHTPGLQRLAERGIRYAHAYTPHPLCVPARVSLWTGRYPHGHGSRRNELLLDPGIDHAWRVWREAGLATGLIGKNHCFTVPDQERYFGVACELMHGGSDGCPPPRGMDWPRPQAAIDEAHRLRHAMPTVSPGFSYAITDADEADSSTGLITEQSVRFITEHAAEPFALWVSFPDPHEPYVAPRRYADMIDPADVDLPPSRPGEFDQAPDVGRILHDLLGTEDDAEADVRAAIAIYHANVKFIDDGVSRILDALDAAGIGEDTIVVFCSDHGDFAGEHGMFSKGGVFYDCLVRVPLIMSYPARVPAGQVHDGMVSLVDVAPTLLRLQGLRELELAHGSPLPGAIDDAVPRDAAFAEYGAGGPRVTDADIAALAPRTGYEALLASLWQREAEGRRKMVRTSTWKYVHDVDGDGHELYDLRADPAELINVVGRAEHAGIVTELRGRLLDWAITTEDGRPVPLPVGEDPRFPAPT